MNKRQNKLTATLRKTLVLFLVGVLFFTGAVSTGALEWNGDSSTGSSTGRPVEDNSFWVSSSALSDLSNIVVAWRFTFYDKDGRKPYYDTANGSGGDGVQYVEIWLPNTSEDFWDSSNYYWISSVVNTSGGNIKYSKLEFAQAAAAGKIAPGPLKLVDRSYSAARKGCWLFGSTNWFDQFGGFSYEIPASSSEIGVWCTNPKNANTLALALGCKNGTAGMRPGDVIVVEPVFWQQANGERVAATASEFASMGALYAGLDSDGLVYSVEGTTDGTWGATCRYTNLKYPTYLYTPDGMGLWNNAVLKSGASDFDKLYTMREIMTGGYGVGIAFGIPKAVSYTLTVNPNGGSWNGTTGTSSFTIDSGSTKTIANPTRTGYTFAGWTVSGGGSISGTTYTQGDGDCTLTAQWTVNSYTQVNNFYKYDPYNGTWFYYTSKSTSAAYGSTFYCTTDGIATPTGYYWSHFNRNSWTVTGDKNDGDGNGHFYPIQYTVTYDANGGSGAPAAQNFYMNGIGLSGTAYYSSTVPTRTGYTFAGWVCRENGISVSAGEAIPNGWESHTLVAQWTVNTYYLDLNGYLDGTVTGNLSGFGTADVYINGTLVADDVEDFYAEYPYGTTYEIKDIKTQTGKQYNGVYSGSLSGTITYTTSVFLDFSTTVYSLTVNPNGGSWNSTTSNSSFTLAYGSTKTIANPTRTGYTFAGWTVSGSGSVSGTTYTQGDGDCTLTAQWTAIPFTVTYNGNGGSGTVASQTVNYDSSITIRQNGFSRRGYNFLGWSTKTDNTDDGYGWAPGWTGTWRYLNGQYGIANNTLNLYARWTPQTYTIKYNANGGTGTVANQTVNYGSNITLASGGFSKTGYTFVGWTTNSDGTDTDGYSWTPGWSGSWVYINGECGISSNTLTLYAQWTANSYTLTVNPNGGSWNSTTSNSSFTLAYGSTKTIANPTRTGYTFAGWTVSGGGSISGTTYTQGDGDCTLTAKWTPYIYTITYNANGGSGAPGRQEKYHGIDITLSIVKPTKVGYVFLGWNTKADGSGTGYAPGASYAGNADVTLYAQWQAAIDISIITPNAPYSAGTEVITSCFVKNNTDRDILPGDSLRVSFTVTKSTGTIVTLSKLEVAIPAGETNMVWFKWTVPASAPSTLRLTCSVSDTSGNVLDSDEKSWHTGKAENYQTPDTVFEAAAPQYWVMPSVPVTNNPSASWWEWVYENGAFEKKEYQAHLETEAFTITPDPDILSNYWNGSVWTMRSGYGIRMDWKTRLVSTGSSDADAGMVTAAQTAYALFPEFGYAQTDNACRLLDRLSGSFVFPVNPASEDSDRLHYTPLWFPDGTQIYKVAGTAYDCWTPAGMISITDVSNGISIDGSIYDDWYIGRFPR